MSKRTVVLLILLTILGVGLRIFWILHVPTQQLYDFATFLETASNIYNGRGHTINGNPMAWVGPGYSYALAFFHLLAGSDNPFNALIFNVILSIATLIMSAFVYFKWFPDDGIKVIIAYGLTAIFPNLIAYNNVAGTETLFLFLLVSLILVRQYVQVGRKQAIIMGILCGLAALVKPFMLAYPAVALAMWWMQGRRIRFTLIRTAVMTAAMLAVIAPWTIRNYRAFGEFILISYNMGYNQIVNNNYANIRGAWMRLDTVPMPEELREQVEHSLQDGRTIKEAYELEPLLGAQARHWMVRNPIAVSQLALLRVQRTFFNGADDISQWAMNDWDFYDGRGISPVRNQRHMHFFEGVFAITVNVFSAAGLLFGFAILWPYVKSFFCRTHDRHIPVPDSTVFIHIAFFVAIVAAFEGQERYAHPVFIFFIYAIIWLCSRKRDNNNPTTVRSPIIR
ncbi:MAG: hypothetical protein FWC91_04075 [Defluviitaleaceae bacterium]|nr:hypothetical protein [Defluviitaleaceae bacterium]